MKTPIIHRALSLLLAALAIYITTNHAQAQSGGSTAWAQLGTLPASTYDVAIDGNTPPTIYTLSAKGLSRSADLGKTWKVCDPDARYMHLAPATVAGDKFVPAMLYTTGPNGPKSSTDGCLTWKAIPTQGILPAGANVRLITTHPLVPGTLFAAMNGLGGLYLTTDGGATWETASKGLPLGTWVTAITTHPLIKERIYIAVRYITRDHPSAYVYESDDTGLSWRSASLGLHVLPGNTAHITGLAWSGDTLFAATASDGLYSYSEQTKSWSLTKLPPSTHAPAPTPTPNPDGISPLPIGIKSLASNAAGVLLINTSRGIFRSQNKAATWESFAPNSVTNPSALTMDPTTGRVLLGAGGRIWGYSISANVAQALPTIIMPTPPPITQETEPTPPPTPPLPTTTRAPIAPTSTPAAATATTTPPPRPGYVPSDPAQPLDPSFSSYFPQTQHNIQRGFRDYWLNNDGLRLLGYPLTEEFIENGMSVQYFERARLEYRDKKIQWGRLGAELTEGQFFQTVRFFVSDDTNAYFGPTQHSVSGPFLKFWNNNGGLTTLGYPISESFKVGTNEYQWFERGRLEWHPNFPEDSRIILGQLGREALQKRGWVK